MKLYKKFSLSFIVGFSLFSFVFLVFLSSFHPALAQVTINPNLPGMNTGTSNNPCEYVFNFYTFALAISGILAFGAIVYGGVKYTLAAGNPSGQNEGKEWIKGALLGLLLLAGAYLILNVINPDLVKCNLPTLDQVSNSSGVNGGGGSGPSCGGVSCATGESECYQCGDPATGGTTDTCGPPNQQSVNCHDTGPATGGCTGGSCDSLSSSGFTCKDAASCSVAPAELAVLNCIQQSSGESLRITEAYPPTTNHLSQCHQDGCCVDLTPPSGQSASCADVQSIVQAANQCGATAVANEWSSQCGGTSYSTTNGYNIHIQGCQ